MRNSNLYFRLCFNLLCLSFLSIGIAQAAPATGIMNPDAVVDLNFDPDAKNKPEQSFIPESDPCLRTAYGETLYPDADLLDFETVDIDEEYKLARMAFLFGRYDYAYKIWEPLAYRGYPKAQATLGWMFHTGKGVRKNPQRAFMWYRMAAQQNHVVAQNNLGVFYEQGVSVRKSYRNAAKWYREAAELGYPYAQYNLGVLYHRGKGVKKDRNEAIFWLQIASLQGVKQARALLEDWGNIPKKHKGKVKPFVRFHTSKKQQKLNKQVIESKGQKQSPHTPVASNKNNKSNTSNDAAKQTNNSAKVQSRSAVANDKQTKPRQQNIASASQHNSRPSSGPTPRSDSSLVRDGKWVLQQNPEHYTLQLAGSTDLKALLTIASKVSNPSKLAYYSLKSKKKEWFNLLYGRFRDKNSANMQLNNLPAELKQYKPWITKFSVVQKRLKK